MKTTMLPSFSRSLTLATTALLLASACDQGGEELLVDRAALECSLEDDRERPEEETLSHSKEIVVSDGDNEVTLRVASEDPELIQHYGDDTFEIVPVFEQPELPAESDEGGDGDETLAAAHDFSQSVLIEERSVALEPGAVGYELRDVGHESRPTPKMCYAPDIYVSQLRFVKLDVTSAPCTTAQISRRWWQMWIPVAFQANQCQGMPSFVGGSLEARRLMLEVCPGPKRVVTFFN